MGRHPERSLDLGESGRDTRINTPIFPFLNLVSCSRVTEIFFHYDFKDRAIYHNPIFIMMPSKNTSPPPYFLPSRRPYRGMTGTPLNTAVGLLQDVT